MAEVLICRIKDYIQPFERRLALQELAAIASGAPRPVDGDESSALHFAVKNGVCAGKLRDGLTYWQSVGAAPEQPTAQVRGEATSVAARNGLSVQELHDLGRTPVPFKPPRKRCLRYATHGLHEYRGKFFPQLARALINIAQVPDDGIVLDPMCGSGTTLVEARLANRRGYGLDMNPLSTFVADVKCRALSLTPGMLADAYASLAARLGGVGGGQRKRSYFASLKEHDQAYLARWFAPAALDELDRVQAAIGRLPTKTMRDFHLVCLSNILRGVSWQKDDDLRVRRDMVEMPDGEVVRRFLKQALHTTKMVAAFTAERGCGQLGAHAVQEADARLAHECLPQLRGRVDAILTSPPYATALPYLDTDRLSLIYLGLLSRVDHRARDLLMIGNREITERRRMAYWAFYRANRNLLPGITRTLVERIDRLNRSQPVGFRRRNLPALLSKYFFDMRDVLQGALKLLRSGGDAFLVVGNNRTTAGGVPVEIQTADHLEAIAGKLGFETVGNLPMEMLASRDVFRKNAMQSEQIIRLRKPAYRK